MKRSELKRALINSSSMLKCNLGGTRGTRPIHELSKFPNTAQPRNLFVSTIKRHFLRQMTFLIVMMSSIMLNDATNVFADGSIQINSIKVETASNGYTVSVDSEIELNATLEQALEKGIVLYFVAKFTLVEPRWYWFDEEVARIKTRIGLRYYALTRQYRLIGHTFSYDFSSLEEALQLLQQSRLHDLPLTIWSELKPKAHYDAELRVWLDLTRMPKPFQVEALSSSAWNLSSDRIKWRMKMPTPDQPLHILVTQ